MSLITAVGVSRGILPVIKNLALTNLHSCQPVAGGGFNITRLSQGWGESGIPSDWGYLRM